MEDIDRYESTRHRLQFLTALGGTIILAIFVNIVELGCTAILPVVYMTTLVNYCANGCSEWRTLLHPLDSTLCSH